MLGSILEKEQTVETSVSCFLLKRQVFVIATCLVGWVFVGGVGVCSFVFLTHGQDALNSAPRTEFYW